MKIFRTLLVSLFVTTLSPLFAMQESELHRAAYKGDVELCKKLIAKGLSILQQDPGGNTPLHLTAYYYSPTFPDSRDVIEVQADQALAADVLLKTALEKKDVDVRSYLRIPNMANATVKFLARNHNMWALITVLNAYGAHMEISLNDQLDYSTTLLKCLRSKHSEALKWEESADHSLRIIKAHMRQEEKDMIELHKQTAYIPNN